MTAQQLKPIEPSEVPANTITPMTMLDRALANGAGIDVLERLMELQERYEANQAKKAYSAAMADAKAEIKPIVKNRKVDFTSQKGRTNYDYEDLAGIADVIDPILSKFGLSYRWRSKQDGSKLTIICVMTHRDGYSEDAAELSAENDNSGNKNSIQAVGSTATFLQRYTLKLAVGLSATKDDDGRKADAPKAITEDQANRIFQLLEETDTSAIDFCGYFEIDQVKVLPSNRFKDALNIFAAKKKKKESGNGDS